MITAKPLTRQKIKNQSWLTGLSKEWSNNKSLILMILPILLFYFIFHYLPMYGAIIAFKDYTPIKGILGSNWVGLANFTDFLSSYYFLRILKNTLLISFLLLIFEFPIPIFLALMINEIRSNRFRRLVQSVSYMPYFISLVVICGIVTDFTGSNGVITHMMSAMAGTPAQSLLQQPDYFRPIYIISEIWQRAGWGSIIYIAALTGIDEAQYEAARIDGAGRLARLWHITLPGIMPTIVIMFVLRLGNVMNVGFEKIILLYNPMTYETADIISSFVYRKGLLEFSWSYSTAVGLFNSVINFALLIFANKFSRKLTNSGLW